MLPSSIVLTCSRRAIKSISDLLHPTFPYANGNLQAVLLELPLWDKKWFLDLAWVEQVDDFPHESFWL
jgi:hypothetical protein